TLLRFACQAHAGPDAELPIDLREVPGDDLRLDLELTCNLVGSPSPCGEVRDHDLRRSEPLTLFERHGWNLARDLPGKSPGLRRAATAALARASQRARYANRRAACGRSWR